MTEPQAYQPDDPPAGSQAVPAAASEGPWSGSLYGWLWRRVPGRWPVKVVVLGLAALAVVALLFTVVFPWAEPRLPVNQVTVGGGGGGG